MSLFALLTPTIMGFLPITTVFLLGMLLPRTAHKKSCNPVNRVLLMIKFYCQTELALGVRGVKLREYFSFSIHAAFCIGMGITGSLLQPIPELVWIASGLISFSIGMTLVCAVYYYRIGKEACARERTRATHPAPAYVD